MAEPRYPNIQTGIGTGRAQVFGANDNSAAFQQIGAALGANTKASKLKRRQKAAEEKLKSLDDLDYGGLTPAQLKFQRQYEEEIRDNATSPEFWQQENAAQILEDKIRDLAILNQENNNAADMGKLVQEATKGKDKNLFNNYSDYKQYYNPEFDIPDAIAKTPAEKARVYNETFVGTANSVTQEFDYDWEEDFDAKEGVRKEDVTVERDGKSISTIQRTFTESRRKDLEEDAVAKLISGMKQERQGDGFGAPKDVSFYKDVTEYVDNTPKYKSRFNAADEQGRLEILKQASKEYLINKLKSRLNEGFKQSPVKDGQGDWNEDSIFNLKEKVDIMQKTRNPKSLEEVLAPYKLSVKVNDDGTFALYKLSTTGSGQNRTATRDKVTEDIDLNNADAIYAALSENVSELSLDDFEKVDYESNLEVSKAYDENREAAQNTIDTYMDVEEMGLSQSQEKYDELLGENEVDVKSLDVININGTDYKITNEESAKKANKAMMDIWVRKNSNKFIREKGAITPSEKAKGL